MECPVCRTSNISGIKYCVNCGIGLENSQEVNSSDIDRYGYRTEEYLSVNNRQSQYVPQDLFTSEESGSMFEEFGFTEQPETSPEEFDFGGQSETNPFKEFDFGGQIENVNSDNSVSFDEEPLMSEPYAEYANNSVPLPAPPYNDMYGQPQIIGYDQNGMPIYGQPQMYQPQVIGYDQNGMPVYGQSQMYQPQFMGYDQNGMPVYGQPYVYPENNAVPQSVPVETPADDTEKFIDFLDDGENRTPETSKEDFFGKSSDMGNADVSSPDLGSLRKRQKKKVHMTDIEIKDAENLRPNDVNKFNQKYMKQAENYNSNDLGAKNPYGRKVSMGRTKDVDAGMLNPKLSGKSRIRMGDAGTADSDSLETYTPERKKKFTMAEADKAVEAMPKKKKYVDELDLIELPDYMQTRKKSKKDKKKFPGMTDL